MLPIVERENALLFYPSQYEGEETSPNIFYTGATPPQQAIPAVNFLRGQGVRRFFLVGTDYIYPRTTNAVLKGYLASEGVTRMSLSAIPRSASPIGARWSKKSAASPKVAMAAARPRSSPQ